MADITVRKLRFDFSSNQGLEVVPGDARASSFWIGLSLTMPYLEPYLIRTMRGAVKSVTDPELAQDMSDFNGQESHHYRNHALFNDELRAKVSPGCAEELRMIEGDLDADYRRFTKECDLRFNIGYAEGFEAMTSALAFSSFAGNLTDTFTPEYAELFDWHLAEEIEHRTVTFDAYEHLVGDFGYRLYRGAKSQLHYLGYIQRFYRCLMAEMGQPTRAPYLPPSILRGWWWRYLRTLTPWYDPGKIEAPAEAQAVLARYAVTHE